MSGPEIAASIAKLAYFVAAIAVVTILPAWLILRNHTDLAPVERFWAAAVMGTTHWTVLVMLLAPLRFHDLVGLVTATVVLGAAYMAIVKKMDMRSIFQQVYHHSIGWFLDQIEITEPLPILRQRGVQLLGTSAYWASAVRAWDFPRVLTWGVFIYAAYLRLYDPVTHYSFGFFDPYVHIVWLKELNAGNLFYDGVYPRGYHAFLSALGTFTSLDPAILIRFIGGVTGALLTPALFFFLLQCRLPWSSALIGSTLMAICTPFHLADLIQRQTASLPEEFAMLFTLISLSFAIRYLRYGHVRDRWIFLAGGFVVWNAHPLAGIAFVVGLTAIGIDYFVRQWHAPRPLVLLARDAVICTIAGNLFLLIGHLLGHPFHGASLQFLQQSADDLSTHVSLIKTTVDSIGVLTPLLVICGIPLVIYGLGRLREPFPSPAIPAIWAIIVFGLWVLKVLIGINLPVAPQRLAMFLPFAVCGIVGWLYALVVEPLLGRFALNPRVQTGCVSLIVGALLSVFYTVPPAPVRPQYEEAARLYYELTADLPPGTWTVVGQAEDYELALDSGQHMTVSKWLSTYPVTEPYFSLPTPYVYLIVEKKPKDDLPQTDQQRERVAEEALLADWTRLYAVGHHDLLIYREDDNVAIYVLYQPEVAWRRQASGTLN